MISSGVPAAVTSADAATEREGVDPREVAVEDEERCGIALEFGPRHLAVRRCDDVMPGGRRDADEQAAHRIVGRGNEDFH